MYSSYVSNEFIVYRKTKRTKNATNVKILVSFKTEASSSIFSQRRVGVSVVIVSELECEMISSE